MTRNILTNKDLLMIFESSDRNAFKVHKKVCTLLEVKHEEVIPASLNSMCMRILKKAKSLKYTKKIEYEKFLKEEVFMPRRYKKVKSITKREPCDSCSEKLQEVYRQNNVIRKLTADVALLRTRLRAINVGSLNRKIKRKNSIIMKQDLIIADLKQTLKDMNEKKRKDKCIQCDFTKSEIKSLEQEIDILKSERTDNDRNEMKLETREKSKGKPFKKEIRELYYNLISLNIGLKNIPKVISAALSSVNIELDVYPSEKTARNFQTELSIISKIQMFDEISNTSIITMHRDATTKKGHHYYGIKLTTESGKTFTIGLKEVSDGKAETYVGTIEEVIQDIGDTVGNANIIAEFYPKLKNCVTDRCATELKVNKIIQEKHDVEINSFKCSVHPILQFQELCEKEVTLIQKENVSFFNDLNPVSSIRDVSKLFFKDSTGDPLLAKNFMKSEGVKSVPIENFRGNRFNTLFKNAAGTYYLKDKLISYLGSKPSLNMIQRNIFNALQNDYVISIIRALGLINSILTEPYMKFAMDEQFKVLDFGPFIERFIGTLKDAETDPMKLMKNKLKVIYGPDEKKSEQAMEISSTLHNSSSLDIITSQFIVRFCKVIRQKCEKTFAEFTDGNLKSPSSKLISEASACPQNNICVERLMGKLDSNIKSSPNINCSTIEGRVMYIDNGTSGFLKNKSDSEKCEIITTAKNKRKLVEETCQTRKRTLFDDTLTIINDKKEKKENSERKKAKKQHDLEEKMKKFGTPTCEKDINEKLSQLNFKKDKLEYLKSQLNFMKTILYLSNSEKELTKFSKKGKQLSVDEMTENLNQLIIKGEKQKELPDPSTLIGKSVKHIWTEENGTDKLYHGKVIAFSNGTFEVHYTGYGLYTLDIYEFIEDTKSGSLLIV